MELDLSGVSGQEQEGPILHLGKKLLPIDEYSNQTGLSRGLLEQYSRIGIVQIRRYKGRTFVVDVPSRPRSDNAEAKAIEELLNSRNRASQAKKLTKLIAELTSTPEVKVKPKARVNLKPKVSAPPPQIPDLQIFETPLEVYGPIDKTAKNRQFGFGQLFAKIPIAQLRQASVVFVVTFLVVSLYASFWLLVAGKVQAGRFARAHTDIQEILGESARIERKIDSVQNQLNDSSSQADFVRAEIVAVTGELDAIHRSNEKSVRSLDEQFAKLKLSK